ncbi:hypothetical protein Bca4012_050255 [Brassica carinata]
MQTRALSKLECFPVEESPHVDDSKRRSRVCQGALYTNMKLNDLSKKKEMAVLGLVLLQRASSGVFDVAYKNFKLAGRDYTEEVLVLPCVALKVVQDAIRIVLEVVFRGRLKEQDLKCPLEKEISLRVYSCRFKKVAEKFEGESRCRSCSLAKGEERQAWKHIRWYMVLLRIWMEDVLNTSTEEPFVDSDHFIHKYFLPQDYAILVPVFAGVTLLSLLSVFIGMVMLKSKKKKA